MARLRCTAKEERRMGISELVTSMRESTWKLSLYLERGFK